MSARRSRLFVLAAALLVPGAAFAVSPPREQATANCVRPQYATDHLVCDTPNLLELDRTLAQLLAAEDAKPQGRWIEPQGQWLRRRSLCAKDAEHEACVRAAYRDRIALLRSYRMPPPPAPDLAALNCDDPAIVSMASADSIHLFYDVSGKMRAYARSGPGLAPGWQDFARMTEDQGVIRVETLDANQLVCRRHMQSTPQ